MIDWTYVYLVVSGGVTVALGLVYVLVGWNDEEMKSVPLYWVGGTVLLMGAVWPLTVIWIGHAAIVQSWKAKGKR